MSATNSKEQKSTQQNQAKDEVKKPTQPTFPNDTSKPMNFTHEEYASGAKVTVTKESLEHREQMREAVKSMNNGQIFARVDDKSLSEWSFPDEKTGEIRSGATPIIKAEFPVLGLIEIKDKDKNIFDKVEKGKSYIFHFRLENKIVNKVSYPTHVFIDAQHLPQFDKKVSSQDLMGQDLSKLDF